VTVGGNFGNCVNRRRLFVITFSVGETWSQVSMREGVCDEHSTSRDCGKRFDKHDHVRSHFLITKAD
jgi:hypothetical protein